MHPRARENLLPGQQDRVAFWVTRIRKYYFKQRNFKLIKEFLGQYILSGKKKSPFHVAYIMPGGKMILRPLSTYSLNKHTSTMSSYF